MAGNGNWAVSGGANAVRLEYYLDGLFVESAKLCGGSPGYCTGSGTWSFSRQNVACGPHSLQIKATPMVISSNGDEVTCTSNSSWLSHTVSGDPTCPPPPPPSASLSCMRGYSSVVSCSASASGGSGSHTALWYQHRPSTGASGWSEGDWYNSHSQCADPNLGYGTSSEWLTIGFKVRDSNGVESATRYEYFECALGNYPDF